MHDLSLDHRPALAWLIAVQPPDATDADIADSLDELARLVKTLGHEVQGRLVQKRSHPDPSTFFGPGKIDELRELMGLPKRAPDESAREPDATPPSEPGAERERWVVVDQDISPSQVRQLSKATNSVVMDRTGVILEIFHRHARSRAAKAQVEIVRLAYLAPRMREMRKGGGQRQRGGVGGKGAGETLAELDRRKIRDRIAELRAELDRVERERTTQRARRHAVRRVALVGYTNAGKSTLMRALTRGDVYIADKLFATLDTTVRSLWPEVEPRIVVSDTVGFIRKLPHDLVASFRSTLDEALEASLLLHVIDASDPAHPHHMATTDEVLREIGAGEITTKLVFNKCDRLSEADEEALRERFPAGLFVSAKSDEDIATLHASIVSFFEGDAIRAWVDVPHERGDVRAALLARAELLEERYDEHGGHYYVRASRPLLDSITQQLAATKPPLH